MPSDPVTRSCRGAPNKRAAHKTPTPSGTRRSARPSAAAKRGSRLASMINSGLTVQIWRQVEEGAAIHAPIWSSVAATPTRCTVTPRIFTVGKVTTAGEEGGIVAYIEGSDEVDEGVCDIT